MIIIKKLIIILTILIFLSGCGVVPDPPIPPEPNGVAYRAFFVGVGDFLASVDMEKIILNLQPLKHW